LLMLRATRSVPVGASSERATDMLSFVAVTCQVEVVARRSSRLPMSRGRSDGDSTRKLINKGMNGYRFPMASGFTTLMGFPSANASNWSTARV
jgi:hypothetical protein